MVSVGVLSLVIGCGTRDDSSKPATTTVAAAPVVPVATATPTPSTFSVPIALPPAAPSAAPSAAASAAPEAPKGYSREGLDTIPSNCTSPSVVFQALTKKIVESEDFQWHYARQIFAADPWFVFMPRGEEPKKHREIAFYTAQHKPTSGVALLAKCGDAATCTRAAALYKTVTPTGKPQLTCGKIPTVDKLKSLVVVPVRGDKPFPKMVVPKKPNEIIPLCVRLAACQAVRDKRLDDDPALSCQQHPNKFRTACAMKPECSAVLKCVEK